MEQNKKSVQVTSFKINYLIVLIIILVFAIYTASFYGIGSNEYFEVGTWFILSGFTLFFPTSLVQILFGIALMFRMFVTFQKIDFKLDADNISVEVQRLYRKKQVFEIPKSEISSAFCQIGGAARQLWWTIPFGVHLAYMISNGVFLAANPQNFGYGSNNGWLYIITGLVDLLILGLILVPKCFNLRFDTTMHKFSLELNPLPKFIENANLFIEIFDIKDSKMILNRNDRKIQLILGSTALVLVSIMQLGHFGFGSYANLALFLFGLSTVIIILQDVRILGPKKIEFRSGMYGIGYDIIPIFGVISIVMAGLTTGSWFRFLSSPFSLFGQSLMIVLVSLFLIFATAYLNKSLFNAEIKKSVGIFVSIYAVSILVSVFL